MNSAPRTRESLTAADLMSRSVHTVWKDSPIRDAARQVVAAGVRGLPVIDERGRCVGMLSVTDLARWSAGRIASRPLPKTCAFQEKFRDPNGCEIVLCLLGERVCPFQRTEQMPDGSTAVICSEPHCVPTEWQMVETEPPEPQFVRDIMSTTVVSVAPEARVAEMARTMLDRGVHRLVILDPDDRPIGIVAANELLQVLAHPELEPRSGTVR